MSEQLPQSVQQLIEMEIDKAMALKAYEANKTDDIGVLIDWITNQQDGQQNQPPSVDKQELDGDKEEGKDEQPAENAEQEPKKLPISDKGLAKQLQEMGHSKIVAEKALFMTQRVKSLDAALDWIDDHLYDDDFQEELFIIEDNKPKKEYTKEEAKALAKQKLAEVRAKKAKEEEEYNRERELMRIQMGKKLSSTQEELKHAEMQRQAMILKQQKRQDEMDKQKMLEQLSRDKAERFGKEYKATGGKIIEKKEKTPYEKFKDSALSIAVASPPNLFPEKAKTCLNTIKIFAENVVKNPTESKYKQINLQNKNVQARIVEVFGGTTTLEFMGFVNENNEKMVLPDAEIIQRITKNLKYLDPIQNVSELHCHCACELEECVPNPS